MGCKKVQNPDELPANGCYARTRAFRMIGETLFCFSSNNGRDFVNMVKAKRLEVLVNLGFSFPRCVTQVATENA